MHSQNLTPMCPPYDIQVKIILTQKDSTRRSLLANAAYIGDMSTFEAVLEAVQTKLGIDQVWVELFLIFFLFISLMVSQAG